jgi:hypothetical protein
MSIVTQLQQELNQARASLARAESEIALGNTGAIGFANAKREQIARLTGELARAQQQDAPGTASAGQVVAEEQRAKADNATVQNPQSPFVQSSTGLNVLPEDEIEVDTNGRIRTTEETQSTPPAPQQKYVTPGRENEQQTPSAPTQAGTGARKEDSGQPTRNSTRVEIDNVFNQGRINPQPNVLDQYASYTYSASLYLIKPEEYKALLNQKKKTYPANQLLIQSAGAPTAGRNSFFSDDFYIDKIEIKSVIAGKGTNAAHNSNTISMTVIEPNGITLIPSLDKAVQALLGSPGRKKTNFTAAIYLLVIRFYGYDDSGNLVRGGVATPGETTQGSAFVEKFYPLAINAIDFKVANKLVEYEISAASPNYQVAAGSNRGTIPYNVELGGITVKDALTGPTVITPVRGATTGATGFTAAELNRRARANGVFAEGDDPNPDALPPPPPNALTAPNPKLTIRQGLMTALNQYQEDLVKAEIYTHPDTYSVEFINTSLEQAKIQVKNPDKKSGGMPVKGTAADKKVPEKQSYDPTSRVISVTAGMQIVQFIDQVLRNSTYLTDQALVRIGENGKQEKNGTPGENVAYYKISLQANPKPGKYDPKRNDFAYDIKYVLSIYRLSDLVSNYFQVPKYNGVHKQYNYWFTGENTQVLSYEQKYNALYTSTLSGGSGAFGGSVVNDAIKANFQPRSGENSQGAAGRVNEIGANAADYLFNPGDLANATLEIVGDPAWLQQGEAFATPGKAGFSFKAFLPDGTINFESQQIMFEILINTPNDYDLDTGIIDPNTRTTIFENQKRPGATRQSYVYRANECVSQFNKGKFTQTLTGSLLTYLPDQTFKEQQALGRSTGTPSGVTPTATATRTLNNPAPPDNEWTNNNGLNTLTADLPTEKTDESEPISLNSPQPQPDPEPPTSDADIVPTTSAPSPSTADIANSPNDGVKEKLALAASYEERAAAARAAGELSNAATLARLAQNSRENAAADAKFGAPPVISNPQKINRET